MHKITDSLSERGRKTAISNLIFYEMILVFLLVITIIITLNTYVFFNVLVDGSSMYPTLKTGDVLVANRQRETAFGDIIVIDGEKTDGKGGYEWLIKRAIAFEGQTVEITDGKVIIDGKVLQEDYLPKGTYTKERSWETTTLGKGEVFYLGDNRGNSEDSRGVYGTCKRSQIVGVVEEWSLSMRWLNGAFYKIGRFVRGGN